MIVSFKAGLKTKDEIQDGVAQLPSRRENEMLSWKKALF